ncbi:MAG TPA: hypothetical protein VF855_07460, partial [Acidimicrobiales bacterium]
AGVLGPEAFDAVPFLDLLAAEAPVRPGRRRERTRATRCARASAACAGGRPGTLGLSRTTSLAARA